MSDGSDKATGEAPARPAPTPMTFVLHSTERYDNDILVFAALDELSYRYVIARIVALEGSSAAHLARHFCKRRGIPFTLVLSDPALAPRDDRPRQHATLLAQKPAALLLFNQVGHWLEMAKAFHAAGVPTNFVFANQDLKPIFHDWTPGHSVPQAPQLRDLLQDARRRRGPRERKTDAHKAEVKREATRRHDEKRRLVRMMKRLQDGTFAEHAWRFRKRKPRAITRAGHRPTTL